ncbi:MAG TPA: protease inhibitor I42 family protein [Allosphingosinicella sp.]|jgi:predicted secreted protein|nr:protease inhibitor I42 family protein [Allosphingosinicella sp.]
MSETLLTENEAGPARVRVGDTVTVRLDEAPTTGFRWNVEPSDPPLRLESDRFEPPPPPLLGGSGSHSWTFRAVAHGAARLVFALSGRGSATPERTQEFRVEVAP